MSSKDGLDFFRRVDLFAKPVTLRLDREQELKTVSGGIITILISILTTSYVTWETITTIGNNLKSLDTESLRVTDPNTPKNITTDQKVFAFQISQSYQASTDIDPWDFFAINYVQFEYTEKEKGVNSTFFDVNQFSR